MKNTYEVVKKWNLKCGNKPAPVGCPDYYKALENQLNRVAEELDEAIKALREANILEIIDAGLDLDVVVAGFNLLAGGDYNAGIKLVTGNNDLKVTKSKKKASNWLQYHLDNGQDDAFIDVTKFGSQTYYCIKRSVDGKILKPGNFPKVDLLPTLPILIVVLLDNSEAGPTEEQAEYFEKTSTDPMYLDDLSDEMDSQVYAVLEGISKEAEGQGAFIYLRNNTVIAGEVFDAKGPNLINEQE